MDDKPRSSKLAGTLIAGGVAVLGITLFGVYLSQSPDKIASWQYERESARKDELAQRIFTAPGSCIGLDVSVFTAACPKLDLDFEQMNWKEGLSDNGQACVLESFRDVVRHTLEYNNEPMKNLENMEQDMSIVLHACNVSSDLASYRPDHESEDAATMLNAWYAWKHSEGNYFN